jgi:hypothetical protein
MTSNQVASGSPTSMPIRSCTELVHDVCCTNITRIPNTVIVPGSCRSVTFEAGVVSALNAFRFVRYYYILYVLYSISWTTGAHLGMILHLVRSDYGPNVIFCACGQKGVWLRTDLLCRKSLSPRRVTAQPSCAISFSGQCSS